MAYLEMVVRIPEEIYKASQIIDVKHEDVVQIPLEVIADGILIPKGHGKIIDVSNLLTVTDIRSDGSEFTYVSYSEIEGAPAIVESDTADTSSKEDRCNVTEEKGDRYERYSNSN